MCYIIRSWLHKTKKIYDTLLRLSFKSSKFVFYYDFNNSLASMDRVITPYSPRRKVCFVVRRLFLIGFVHRFVCFAMQALVLENG